MRFRSVRVQLLPLFAHTIAIFKRELETIDVFRSFFQLVMSWNTNVIDAGFSTNPFTRNLGLFPSRVERHQHGMNTIRMINGDKPRIKIFLDIDRFGCERRGVMRIAE